MAKRRGQISFGMPMGTAVNQSAMQWLGMQGGLALPHFQYLWAGHFSEEQQEEEKNELLVSPLLQAAQWKNRPNLNLQNI